MVQAENANKDGAAAVREWLSDEERAEMERKRPWHKAERWIFCMCLALSFASAIGFSTAIERHFINEIADIAQDWHLGFERDQTSE